MSTAEYAVGMVAAAAFAGLLFKIVTSSEVRALLLSIIKRALQLAG
ncbi:putative membrane protein [Actinomadura viridis]|uniref:Membrane protein n=2 Tax=Actinomadura viridis TaxID=58110 RepID=A0A931GLU3_9ACTN|nr:putative membrane protein [Actinomadura viridis]